MKIILYSSDFALVVSDWNIVLFLLELMLSFR